MQATAADTGKRFVQQTNTAPFQPPVDAPVGPLHLHQAPVNQRGGFETTDSVNASRVMAGAPVSQVAPTLNASFSAKQLESLGALEEQVIQAEHGDSANPAQAAELKKKLSATKGPLVTLANKASGKLPRKVAVTLTLGLAIGIPGVISVGTTGFMRLSGRDTTHQPLDIGASLGASSFGAWASYVMGNKAVPPKTDGDSPIPASNGHDETKKGARQGFQAGASILGYGYVNTMNPVLKNQQVGVWIPHLCAFSLSSDGSFGGSISIPIPFCPVLRVPIGIYIEHPWFSVASKPVFKAIHKAEAFARKHLAPVAARAKEFLGHLRDTYGPAKKPDVAQSPPSALSPPLIVKTA